MRAGAALLVLVTLLAGVAADAAEPLDLIRARDLYNAADYDGAIAAASLARLETSPSDVATLVLGRAHLERFRAASNPADLAAARMELGSVRLARLSPRDQVDLLIGLGQSLYLSNAFGAALELFESALARGALLDSRDRLLRLDWWATALDRQAQGEPAERRVRLFERMLARMEDELRVAPGNGPANYWITVGARGAGDLDRAWSAAIAGWVRANLDPEGASALRADLDRLVTEALIPERARQRSPGGPEDAMTALRVEWDGIKQQWP
jgi:hypothetical protein